MKPIEDRTQVSNDFPAKFDRGAFESESRYDTKAEGDGLVKHFERSGNEKRSVAVHRHHSVLAGVLAGLLTAWAESLKDANPVEKALG